MKADLKIMSLPQKGTIEIKREPVIENTSLLSLKRVKPTEMGDSDKIIGELNKTKPIIANGATSLDLKELLNETKPIIDNRTTSLALKEQSQIKKIDDKKSEKKALEEEIKVVSKRPMHVNSIANSFFSNVSNAAVNLLVGETAIGESLKDPMVFNATSSVLKNVATNSIGLTDHGIGGIIMNALSASGAYSFGAKQIGFKLLENFVPGGSFISMGLKSSLNLYKQFA